MPFMLASSAWTAVFPHQAPRAPLLFSSQVPRAFPSDMPMARRRAAHSTLRSLFPDHRFLHLGGIGAHVLPPLSWGAHRAAFVGDVIRFLLLSPAYEHPTTSTILYASALESRPCPRTTPIRHRRGSESWLQSRSPFACSAQGIWVLQRRMETASPHYSATISSPCLVPVPHCAR
ncbi:hypothetical protein B0H13DRAFT_365817 [Mycena leptocephala]|nr:hypothetical protein B0H13DRAFT_365817 [Mycena leptocephala]